LKSAREPALCRHPVSLRDPVEYTRSRFALAMTHGAIPALSRDLDEQRPALTVEAPDRGPGRRGTGADPREIVLTNCPIFRDNLTTLTAV